MPDVKGRRLYIPRSVGLLLVCMLMAKSSMLLWCFDGTWHGVGSYVATGGTVLLHLLSSTGSAQATCTLHAGYPDQPGMLCSNECRHVHTLTHVYTS